WMMNPDGSGRRRLTHDRMLEVDPVWAPGGARIAFAALVDPRYRHVDLWVMAADGSRRQQVTHQPEGMMAVSPAWSPDAQQLAFGRVAWDGSVDAAEVWITDLEGGRSRRVGSGIPVGWSPAGDLLV